MWSYYGSKSKIVKLYPKPKFKTIIEPFAGAAWYSVSRRRNKVILNEKFNTIYYIWKWLIREATPEQIIKYLDFYIGQDIRYLNLPKEQKDLIGFCINQGSASPGNIVQKWSCQVKSRPDWSSTAAFALRRIARILPEIKHWQIRFGDYRNLPNIEATWFIDPPYQFGGKYYIVNDVNYKELATWCRIRKGQVIVCENTKADWLPFRPLIVCNGQKHQTIEAVFES